MALSSPVLASEPAAAPSGPQRGKLLRTLERDDTAALKGLAIIAIVLHNFFHAVSPAHQNEFRFHAGAFSVFLGTVVHPSLALQACFSFFGHFGVQVFIFCSAFGLAKSHWGDEGSWAEFMAGRMRKIYPMFGLVVLPWSIVVAIQAGPWLFLKHYGLQLVLMFAGLSPFLPNSGLPPIGPWWFIPFIVEFYAMFFALRWLTKRLGWGGLLALSIACMAITAFANPLLAHWSMNLLETPLGRMPNVCLGIAAALYPMRFRWPMAGAGLAIVVLGSEYSLLWPLTSAAALLPILWVYMEGRERLRSSRVLQVFGRYALPIFLLNGIVRNELVPLSTTPALQLLYGALDLGISLLLSIVIQDFLAPKPAPVAA